MPTMPLMSKAVVHPGDLDRELRELSVSDLKTVDPAMKTISASIRGDTLIVRIPARFSQAQEREWVQRMLERVQRGEIDPSFVITHRLSLDEAPQGYQMFRDKQDDCMKVVLKP